MVSNATDKYTVNLTQQNVGTKIRIWSVKNKTKKIRMELNKIMNIAQQNYKTRK